MIKINKIFVANTFLLMYNKIIQTKKGNKMKREFKSAYTKLAKLGCPVYEHTDDNGRFSISAEDSESYKWCDYYDGYWMDGWDFGINPKITEILNQHGLWAEWQNPGRLVIFKD